MENTAQFGNYQILRKIGGGGMADVYEAVRIGLENFQTRVALKCILPSMTRDERFVKMFINEAHLGSQLQHPNIIQIQDFNKVNDTYYIAMEFVDGVDLSRIIKRLRARGLSFPATVVLDLGFQALAGLGYAHKAKRADGTPLNIIHRDVKPSNFLITPGGTAKIGDFGIAKAADSTTSHSLTGDQLKGTIHYMSPEQVDGVPLTPASDLFCLGSILFEMLTLRPLFVGPTMSAVLLKIVMVNIESDMQIIANNYPEFEPLLRRALALDPKERFSNAAEMAESLHKLRESYEDGISLRQFLAMHMELFEAFGTQPGDDEDEASLLSICRSPARLAESPVEVPVAPYREAREAPSFELEPSDDDDHGGYTEEAMDPIIVDEEDEPDSVVAFDYYPPAPAPPVPDIAFSSDPGLSDEHLGEMAQMVLSHDEDDPIAAERASGSAEAISLMDDIPDALTMPDPDHGDIDAQTGLPEDADLQRLFDGDPALHPEPSDLTSNAIHSEDVGGWLAIGIEDDGGRPASTSSLTQEPLPSSAPVHDVANEDVSAQAVYSPPKSPVARKLLLIIASLVGGIAVATFLFFMAISPKDDISTPANTTLPENRVAPTPARVPLTPEAAQLVISSIPAGAHILFNDSQEDVALTPSELLLPIDQNHVIVRLELEGYQPFMQEITYTAGQRLNLAPTLVPIEPKGDLEIFSSPDSATVFLDGEQSSCHTPCILRELDATRAHTIGLQLAGYQDWTKEVRIVPSRTETVSAKLARIQAKKPIKAADHSAVQTDNTIYKSTSETGIATLILSTVPPDAEVYVDGKRQGEVPISIKLKVGPHRIIFKTFKDQKRKEITVDLVGGEERRLVWEVAGDRWLSR